MELTHFSYLPLKLDLKRQYALQRCDGMKPGGLWLSDENDYGWSQWCQSEGFGGDRLALQTKIIVDPEDLCVLGSVGELREFNQEFKRPLLPGVLGGMQVIDWKRVKGRWKGIVITPYQWSVRLCEDFFWYYSWDCASGCVWDLSAISEVGRSIPHTHSRGEPTETRPV